MQLTDIVVYYLEMDNLITTPLPTQHLPYELACRPVTGMSADYADGWLVPEHSHQRAQLLYAVKGVMVIQSKQGRWIVPPSLGVWIEARELDSVRMHGQVAMKTLFIDPHWEAVISRTTGVLTVSPLLRELIIAMTLAPMEYAADSRESRIARLILDEMRQHPTVPLHLPWPTEQRLKNVCDQIVNYPDQAKTAQAWAHTLAISEKSFHRHFKQQTGITYGQWREQARMLKALEEIAKGQKLLHVALTCGYESQSAFSAVFRKHFGKTPSAYYQTN